MENSSSPALGALAARAHDLLLEVGHPVQPAVLIEHVFGRVIAPSARSRSGASDFWHGQLARLLGSGAIFTQCADGSWGLAEWGNEDIALEDLEYVVVDCETTGLDPQTQRVIEVAAIRCRGPVVLERYTSLIDPQRPIPLMIRQLTGITPEVLRGAPEAGPVLERLLELSDGRLLVGHNVRFDYGFLTAETQRHLHVRLANPAVCTLRLAQHLLPHVRRLNLDNLAAALALPAAGRHRAMGDADLTQRAFWALVELARQRGIATQSRLQAIAGIGRNAGTSGRSRASASTSLLDPALRVGVPEKPGVYLMRDARGEVIYVGKAKNLKKRIASYYSRGQGYRRHKDGLLGSVRHLETRVVGSELEALIVESRLIKEYLPRFNVQQRYYAGYSFIKVDVSSPFPRVVATHEVDADGARYFGPFRSKRVVDTVIDLVHRLYPVRTCTRKLSADGHHRGKAPSPCFRYMMHRCLGPCLGGVSAEEYAGVVRTVLAFLEGGNDGMLGRVEEEMFRAARAHDFELASRLRDTLRQAERLLVSQQLLTGAIERNNLVIVCPSAVEGHVELFGIRHGRLFEQCALSPDAEGALQEAQRFLGRLFAATIAPPVVGKEEIDAIIIIGRWVARYADSRQVISLPDSLNETIVAKILQTARDLLATPAPVDDDQEWAEESEARVRSRAPKGFIIGASEADSPE